MSVRDGFAEKSILLLGEVLSIQRNIARQDAFRRDEVIKFSAKTFLGDSRNVLMRKARCFLGDTLFCLLDVAVLVLVGLSSLNFDEACLLISMRVYLGVYKSLVLVCPI